MTVIQLKFFMICFFDQKITSGRLGIISCSYFSIDFLNLLILGGRMCRCLAMNKFWAYQELASSYKLAGCRHWKPSLGWYSAETLRVFLASSSLSWVGRPAAAMKSGFQGCRDLGAVKSWMLVCLQIFHKMNNTRWILVFLTCAYSWYDLAFSWGGSLCSQ